MEEREFEFRCRRDFFGHVKEYDEEKYQRLGHAYLGPKCCGQTMMLTRKLDLDKMQECPVTSCSAALHSVCSCWNCYGKFHGTERWRNHYLKGTTEEYLIHRPLEVKFVI